jgi:hypothetical protein
VEGGRLVGRNLDKLAQVKEALAAVPSCEVQTVVFDFTGGGGPWDMARKVVGPSCRERQWRQ